MDHQGKALADPVTDRGMATDHAQTAARHAEIADMLGMASEPARSAFTAELGHIADAYRLDLDVVPFYGRPKEQRAALRALRKSVGETIDRMELISAEYAVQLDAMLTPSETHLDRGQSLMLEAQNLLPLLELAIDRFDRNYSPKRGRPTDVPLEEAIRSLIGVIDDATGQKPLIKQNKTTGAAPELGSPEAKAIGTLLRAINPRLTETAIANMIEKVKNDPIRSDGHLEEIWNSDPDHDLKLMLRPINDRD
jgi:hypothetical protein